jgi:electron transfer flavoprotein alpha subunit
VFAEQRDSNLTRVSLELLGKAQELAEELGQEVSAVLLGHQISALIGTLVEYGADNIFYTDHEVLKNYRSDAYAKVVEELVNQYRPNIFLIGATHIGRDLAPRVSRRVAVGLTADCTELSIDSKEQILLQIRPAFGGNVMATIANRYSRPQMATVRPGVMEMRQSPGKGNAIEHKAKLSENQIKTRVLQIVREKKKGVDLSKAKIIVAGGRGVGDAQGFDNLRGLAEVMDGQVAGTRITVEEGWIPPEGQVGQTGRTVRPEIYIACGISGAVQHRAGMMNSRYIIAINTDPKAPIFQIADWGIVADLHDVVPEMTRQLREAKDRAFGI